MSDSRLQNEIEHGKFLVDEGAGDVWNWESPAGKIRWARRVAMLTAHLSEGMEVLELGCGTGYFTSEAAKTGARITAVDISESLLDEARKNISYDNVNFMIENAYDLSCADFSFDSVIGSSVLHHLDIERALSEIYRVLKPGGTLFFTEPNMLNPQIALERKVSILRERAGNSPDETAFFSWEMRRLLTDAGFSLIEVNNFDFLHPAIPSLLIPAVKRLCDFVERVPFLKQISGSIYIRATKI